MSVCQVKKRRLVDHASHTKQSQRTAVLGDEAPTQTLGRSNNSTPSNDPSLHPHTNCTWGTSTIDEPEGSLYDKLTQTARWMSVHPCVKTSYWRYVRQPFTVESARHLRLQYSSAGRRSYNVRKIKSSQLNHSNAYLAHHTFPI